MKICTHHQCLMKKKKHVFGHICACRHGCVRMLVYMCRIMCAHVPMIMSA